MGRILLAWVGKTDLRAPAEERAVGTGPIAQALDARPFDETILLSDHLPSEVEPYVAWLKRRTRARIEVVEEKLSGPTDFGEIYEAALRACTRAREKSGGEASLTFHLSPGTPAMAAVWILLGKARFNAELIESSREQGVRTATVPFDIWADFLPDLLRERDERLRRRSAGDAPAAPEFGDIVYRSPVMTRLVERARRVAVRNVPVLIEGESGTGKEMLARAIHRASPRFRSNRDLLAVNCGAIPAELVESELFGHAKGAFTGAATDRLGYFQRAHGSTLFLDELGELPAAAQVKLLRVLQEGEIVPVGTEKPVGVDVRIIAATNRTLTEELAAGRFREDLFYRIAVAVLRIPPLRDRSGDLPLLIEALLAKVNEEAGGEPGLGHKKLSVGARKVLLEHSWPGNVRELWNTLQRAALWSEGPTISADEARDAILPVSGTKGAGVLDRPLGGGFKLEAVLDDVSRHYLRRAYDEAKGEKTMAAKLVGLGSYQSFTNWAKRLGIRL